jgi:adenylyltransferase/sulfurtransferase
MPAAPKTRSPSASSLTDAQLLRYARQLLLPEIDIEGQTRLLNSRALVFGMGGLGSPVAMYLATSGVGELVIADPDRVELSNLQRQIAHTTESIGENKAASARRMLGALNPEVRVTAIERKLDAVQARREVERADVVIDCTDNFEARFTINRACVAARKPLVSGAVVRMEGQVSVFRLDKPESPCYACLYAEGSEAPMACAEFGVLGAVAGIIGCVQATEAVKLLLNIGEPLVGRLLLLDARTMNWQTIRLTRDPECPACSGRDRR